VSENTQVHSRALQKVG